MKKYSAAALLMAALTCASAAENLADVQSGGGAAEMTVPPVMLTVPLELDPIPSGMQTAGGEMIDSYKLRCEIKTGGGEVLGRVMNTLPAEGIRSDVVVTFDGLTDVALSQIEKYICMVYLGVGEAFVVPRNVADQSRALITSDDDDRVAVGRFE